MTKATMANSSRWSGILLGAVTSVGLQAMFVLLGVALGLLAFPFEQTNDRLSWIGLGVGGSLYLGVTMALSYFAGGYIASRLYPHHDSVDFVYPGLATWSTVVVAAGLVGAMVLLPVLTAAGTGAGALAVLEGINRTKPRIVTDLKLLEGKAVTFVDLRVTPEQVAKIAQEKAASPEAKEAAEVARKATAALSLALFVGLLVSAIASVFGARVGSTKSELATRETWQGNPVPAPV